MAGKMDLDPVTLEVIRNALPAIANEMAIALQHTSYNMVIYATKDFCTALVNPDGELVCQNAGGVSHFVADLGVVITDVIGRQGREGIKPGDVFITNHQAVAGQHLNNMVVYTPCFHGGELVMFAMTRAHWIDVGGSSTGFGGGPTTADPWIEGLQLNQLKLYEEGVRNETLHTVLSDNIRYPESSLGDLRSQITACRVGMRRFEELLERYGKPLMMAGIEQIFDESEAKCRNIIRQFPDGVYEAERWIDNDGVTPDEKVTLHAKVTIANGEMTVDLSGCSLERRAAINSRTLAPARIAYKALTSPNDPVNEGAFRALKTIVKEGTICWARWPAPMASWSFVLPMLVDVIIAAMAQAVPDRAPAGHWGLMATTVFFGMNPKTNRRFVVNAPGGGGWGGRPFEDGESASCNICQGDVRTSTIEEMEMKNPILILERRLRDDSAGPGKYRGGFGSTTHMVNLVEGRWTLEKPRRQSCPPWGIAGGLSGEAGMKLMRKPGETEFKDMDVARYLVPANTEVIVHTGSGGGWGDPLDRDFEAVMNDVREGLVSREAARGQYGIVVGEDMRLDRAATEELRSVERRGRASEVA